MPTCQREAPASLRTAYDRLEPLITATANRVAKRFRTDPDEVRADALLDFVEAYRTWDAERSTLEQRTVFVIERRFTKRAMKPTVPVVDTDPDTLPKGNPPEPFSLSEFALKLSHDAQVVLAVLVDGPRELDAAIWSDPNPGPESVRRHLKAHLQAEHGWTHSRVWDAFREIGNNL